MSNLKQYLQYVRNTNGGATKDHFIDDYDPIGETLWKQLKYHLYVSEDTNGRIYLTDAGNSELDREDV